MRTEYAGHHVTSRMTDASELAPILFLQREESRAIKAYWRWSVTGISALSSKWRGLRRDKHI